MKNFFLISLIVLFFAFCSNHPTEKKSTEKTPSPTEMNYIAALNETKKTYPFSRWREAFRDGLTQYTETNCNSITKIFDDLISDLIAAGPDASEDAKKKCFEKAILATNELDAELNNGFIETGEREDLCELTNVITVACGLDPEKYGDGEGLATEWREW